MSTSECADVRTVESSRSGKISSPLSGRGCEFSHSEKIENANSTMKQPPRIRYRYWVVNLVISRRSEKQNVDMDTGPASLEKFEQILDECDERRENRCWVRHSLADPKRRSAIGPTCMCRSLKLARSSPERQRWIGLPDAHFQSSAISVQYPSITSLSSSEIQSPSEFGTSQACFELSVELILKLLPSHATIIVISSIQFRAKHLG